MSETWYNYTSSNHIKATAAMLLASRGHDTRKVLLMHTDHTPNALAAQQSTTEEWRAVVGYEGRYEVSSFGRVRSLFYCGRKRKAPVLLKPQPCSIGYLRCHLFFDGANKGHSVHRLVLRAFVGDSPFDGNHKDGDKTNNRLDNLEYVTHRENLRHAADVLGRWADMRVADCYNEPSERDLQIWAMVDAGMTQKAIASHFGISAARISFIANQKRKRLAALGSEQGNGPLSVRGLRIAHGRRLHRLRG